MPVQKKYLVSQSGLHTIIHGQFMMEKDRQKSNPLWHLVCNWTVVANPLDKHELHKA